MPESLAPRAMRGRLRGARLRGRPGDRAQMRSGARFQSAGEFDEALAAVQEQLDLGRRPTRREWLAIAAIGVTGVSGVFTLRTSGGEGRRPAVARFARSRCCRS